MMNLDKRQKVILGLIVLALIVLAWQIYKLVGADNDGASQSTTAAQMSPAKVKPTSYYPAAAEAVKTNAEETAAMLSNAANTAPGANDSSDPMAVSQQKYLELVNEYQMSEIQKMIADDQASIAQSRYNAAQALSKISELSGGQANLSDLTGANDQANPADYELIYTGEDNGQWTATLKKNGQFNDVTAGSALPDGSKVLTVDDNGVLLQESNNNKELVTFNGITPFSGAGSNNSSAQTSTAQNLQSQLSSKNTSNVVTTTASTSAPSSLVAPSQSQQTTASTQTNNSVPQANSKTVSAMSAATPTSKPTTPTKPITTPTTSSPTITFSTSNTAAKPTAGKTSSLVPNNQTTVASAASVKPTTVATSAPANKGSVENFIPVKQPDLSQANVANPSSISNNAAPSTSSDFMSANKSEYTIQIIADNQINSVNDFITSNKLQGQAYALKTIRNGKPWYIAVYGEYDSVASAEKAISDLSGSVRVEHPFVRRIGDVQDRVVS